MNKPWNNGVVTARPKQFLLPPPVDAVIGQLLDAGRREGSRLSRSDVVGALVWQGRGMDGDALGVIVRAYRRESQGDVPAPTEKLQPGPRPYSNQARP